MSWLKRVLLALAAITSLTLVLLCLILLTPVGNRLVWEQLTRQLPQLQGELVSGSLGEGWHLRHLRWQDTQLTFSAAELHLAWRLERLLFGQLEVEELAIRQGRLQLDLPSEPIDQVTPEPATPSTPALFSMPIAIQLQRLRVDDFEFVMPKVVKVAVGTLETAARWQGTRLSVMPSLAEKVDVELLSGAVQPVSPQTKTPAPVETDSLPPPLPTVLLPFELQVQSLRLDQGRYHQAGFDTGLMDLTLAGEFAGELLQVERLTVKHALGEAELGGEMTFRQHYALDATLTGRLQQDPWLEGQLEGREANLKVTGDLARLGVELSVAGKEQLAVSGWLAPLTEKLPFQLKAGWQALGWPLKGKAEYRLGKGGLTLEGSLAAYRLGVDSSVKVLDYPRAKLTARLTGDLEQARVVSLILDAGHSQARIDGHLDWRHGLDWQGLLALSSRQLKAWSPQLDGRLEADIKSAFRLRQDGWQLKLPQLQARGRLNGYPLTLKGQLQGNNKLEWQFRQIELLSGPNQLRLDGTLGKRWALQGDLQAPRLATLSSALQGDLQGRLQLSGLARQPSVAVELNSQRLSWQELSVRGLKLEGQLDAAKGYAGVLHATVSRLRQSGQRLNDITLSANGNAKQHRLELTFDGKELAGHVQLTGGLAKGAWQGRLVNTWFNTPAGRWQLAAPLTLASRTPWRKWQLGRQCWTSEQASLCAEAASLSPELGQLTVALKNFRTERLAPWLPAQLQWQSQLSASGELAWRGGQPDLTLALDASPGTLTADQLVSEYERLHLEAHLDSRQARMRFDFISANLGEAQLDLQVTDPRAARRLAGNVRLQGLRLDTLAPLVDEVHRIQGRVDAQGRLGGTLANPLFYGQVSLDEGELDTSLDLASVRRLQARLDVSGNRAQLTGTLHLGKGELSLAGDLDWQTGQPSGQLQLQGKGLELGLTGYGRSRMDMDLRVMLAQQLQVRGNITIPWARIEVKELPETVVDISPDVVIVRRQFTAAAPARALPFSMNVTLRLGSDVRLSAMGLKTRLTGRLDLVQRPGDPLQGTGIINLVDGTYKAYGQNLLIRTGKLTFAGDLSRPLLLVEAIRNPDSMEDSSITVGVKVTGETNAPKVTTFSEPSLSETEKLSYLLRGHSSTTSGGNASDAMTAMLLGAGIGRAGGIVSGLAEELGLADVTLDTRGSGQDTQVSISGYVLPKLQVQYGMGLYSPVTEVRVRYEIMPRLYIQFINSVSQAVDIFYKFEF